MSILPLQISQRVLTGSDLNPIFSGAQNIDSIKVTFDAEWSGFAKTAVFSRNGLGCYFSDLDSTGTTLIPAAVLEESGTIFIGIMGEKGDQRITSSLVRYRVGEGASVTDLLDPETVHSLMDLVNEALADSGGITGKRTGTTFTPSVSSAGVISWTNDGGLDNPSPVNIKGAQGVGVQSVSVYLARSTSSTSAPTSGYSTSVPTLTSGEKGDQRITSSLVRYRVGEGASVTDLLDPETVHSLMDLVNEALADSGGITGKRTGTTFTPSVSSAGVISWTNDGGLDNPSPVNIKGAQGVGVQSVSVYLVRSTSSTSAPTSGYSTSVPTLTSSYRYLWGYLRFTLTNNQTTETAKMIMGVYGNTGAQGPSGVSPTLSATKADKTTTITITDANGTRELAQILDGIDGTDGSDVTSKISSIVQYY